MRPIKDILIRKAKKSICHIKVAALGINKRGEVVGCCYNSPKFSVKGGGIHAEAKLIRKYGPQIRTIIICRVSNSNLRPIHPCAACAKLAKEFGIEIQTLDHN